MYFYSTIYSIIILTILSIVIGGLIYFLRDDKPEQDPHETMFDFLIHDIDDDNNN